MHSSESRPTPMSGGSTARRRTPTGDSPAGGEVAAPPDRARWLALSVLCLASLMIVLDSSIVNVALPSVRSDLGFSAAALAWVVNAYTLTFGGFLLLAGR